MFGKKKIVVGGTPPPPYHLPLMGDRPDRFAAVC